jgi:translation initiation factor IF-2
MKAIDLATKNHITMQDLIEVCKELDITCSNDDHEFNEQDIFLIEKKVEIIKSKKAKQAEKTRQGKKIKLKRKVSISREKGKEGSPEAKPVEEKKDAKPAHKPEDKKKEGSKPQGRTGKPGSTRPGSDRRDGGNSQNRGGKPGQRPDRKPGGKPGQSRDNRGPAKPEAPVAEELGKGGGKKKKQQVKGKDEKHKYKKEQGERSFDTRKRADKPKGEVVTPESIAITENISVHELSKKLRVKANEVIAKLMKLGVMATINEIIDADTAEILAGEYGTTVKVVSLYDETIIKSNDEDRAEDHTERPPVVTVMGHVDHGKTKLLDAIRETNIVDGEHGGITQHIGAYMVNTNGRRVTFLDTPGHAAFTTMRARGAEITDIVILVVAANDGVMPQTKEAINHAKDAGVPIIVAINKIDLEDANIQKVRQELSNYELIPEEWGGTTLFAEISAKQKINIDGLLEMILIQSEMLELKANAVMKAKGTVIEAKLDQGRGAVCTILIQQGVLKVGDPFVVGIYSGKIRAMFDDQGKEIQEAGPSTPVEILGISGVPGAGDPFEVVASDKQAKQVSQKRLEYHRIEAAKKYRKVTLESLNEMIKEGEVQELRIIVKADVDGSAQALSESLEKLSNEEIRVKVIHTSTGGINESDVMLASASNAIIIGYHVRPTGKVADIAAREDVSIKFYSIIFEATDDVKAAMEGMLSPEIKEEIQGTGEVKQLFKVSKIGTIAGSICLSGKIERSSKIRIIRDGVVIYDGMLKSLKRFKDDISLVETSQEFGFALDGFNDLKEGDTCEAYRLIEVAKTLD